MPEGDTIATVAARLRELIEGATLVEAHLRTARGHPLRALDLAGRTVERIDSVGKHLLVFAGDDAIRVHLGMTGSWHRYARGEAWRRPRVTAWVVLVTDAVEVVCFDPKEVERFPASRVEKNDVLARLGPDLLGDGVAWAEVVRRARERVHDDGTAGALLLDQTVAAGLGNVYRSEVLFLERIHPDTPVHDLDDAAIEALYRRGRALMRANVGTGRRRTTAGSGARSATWVYDREGRPCLQCGAAVRSALVGRHARVVFWCPSCQKHP